MSGDHNRYQKPDKPTAWHYAGSRVEPESVALDCDLQDAEKANCTPLYTASPQREWQGLTDEEREEATGWSVEHIEAVLKAKNG